MSERISKADQIYFLFDNDSGPKRIYQEEWMQGFMDVCDIDYKELENRMNQTDPNLKMSGNKLSQIKNCFAKITIPVIVPLFKALTSDVDEANLLIEEALRQVLPKTIHPYLTTQSMRGSDILKRSKARKAQSVQLALELRDGTFMKAVVSGDGKYRCSSRGEQPNKNVDLYDAIECLRDMGRIRAISEKGKHSSYSLSSKRVNGLVLLQGEEVIKRY